MSLDYGNIVIGDTPENPSCPNGCDRSFMTSIPLNRKEIRERNFSPALKLAKSQHPLSPKIEILSIFCTKCEFGSWDIHIVEYADKAN